MMRCLEWASNDLKISEAMVQKQSGLNTHTHTPQELPGKGEACARASLRPHGGTTTQAATLRKGMESIKIQTN